MQGYSLGTVDPAAGTPPVENELWWPTRDAVGRRTETLAEKIALTSGYFMAYSVRNIWFDMHDSP